MSITDFLNARIAEDEAVARAALDTQAPDEWENPTQTQNHWPANIAFWDRNTPARVLAECAAKRAILELWEDPSAGDSLLFDAADGGYILAIDRTVRTLAAVYANHPEYQAKWKVRA